MDLSQGAPNPGHSRARQNRLFCDMGDWRDWPVTLMLFLHAGDREVGGFGVSSEEDLLCIADSSPSASTASRQTDQPNRWSDLVDDVQLPWGVHSRGC
jgi:hypothetical protein